MYKFLAWMMAAFQCGAMVAHISAQETGNLSGTWVKDSTRSESAAQAPQDSAQTTVRMVIEQSQTAVRVERYRLNGSADVITYRFADTTSEAKADSARTSGTEVDEARAEWKEGRLLLTTVLHVNGMAVTTAESFFLAAGNRELVVETQLQMQHGYQGSHPDSKSGSTGRDIYIKGER